MKYSGNVYNGQEEESRQYKILGSEIKLAAFGELFAQVFTSLLHHEGAGPCRTGRWHRPLPVPQPHGPVRLETLML